MFLALSAWNLWYPIMVYTNSPKLWSLQYYLRTLVFDSSFMQSSTSSMSIISPNISPKNIQMAAVVLVALPIVLIYPFVQRFFVKGLLIGAVKE